MRTDDPKTFQNFHVIAGQDLSIKHQDYKSALLEFYSIHRCSFNIQTSLLEKLLESNNSNRLVPVFQESSSKFDSPFPILAKSYAEAGKFFTTDLQSFLSRKR